MEDEDHLDTVYIEGIKERLEDLVEDDIFHTYGMLVAEGKMDFDISLVGDPSRLYKCIRLHKDIRKPSMEW